MIVVVAHGSIRLWPKGAWLRSGWVGVQIFFVLSGFLITYLMLAEKQRTQKISLKDFYIRRALRIWPLYYFMLGMYAFVLPRLDQASFSGVFVGREAEEWGAYRDNLWPHAVFLQNYLVEVSDVRIGLGVYWSLAVEEHFYLVWPLVVTVVGTRLLPWLLGLAILASAGSSWLTDLNIVPRTPGYGELTHNNVFPIAIGCLVGYVWAFHADWVRGINSRLLAAGAIGSWLVVVMVLVDDFSRVETELVPGPFTVSKILIAAASGVLILRVIARPPDDRYVVLSHPFAVHIGKVSFGIYLTHVLVLGMFARSARSWGTGSTVGAIAAMVIFAWLSVVVADLVYRRIESPILTLKHRFQRF